MSNDKDVGTPSVHEPSRGAWRGTGRARCHSEAPRQAFRLVEATKWLRAVSRQSGPLCRSPPNDRIGVGVGRELEGIPNLRVTPERPGPRAAPPSAWRAVENRAALHRVGPPRPRPSGPAPAAPRARRRRGRPGTWPRRAHPSGGPWPPGRSAESRPGCGRNAARDHSVDGSRRKGGIQENKGVDMASGDIGGRSVRPGTATPAGRCADNKQHGREASRTGEKAEEWEI
jgi:hypothetical protein